MFDENFSFDAARSPSLDSSTAATRDSSRAVSPCTAASAPLPSPRMSVTDLTTQFAQQRIQRESQITYDSCESYANVDNDADWSIPSVEDDESNSLRRSRTFPQRPHSPSRRVQRQINTRLLCTASHHRDIATLVARMVDSEDQCSITPSEPASPSAETDEGYNSSDEPMVETSRSSSVATLPARSDYRRASDLASGGACVNKAVRLRRDKNHKRIRSSEKSS